jgi:hypothetical protein
MADSPLDRTLVAETVEIAKNIVAAVAEWQGSIEQSASAPVTLYKHAGREQSARCYEAAAILEII